MIDAADQRTGENRLSAAGKSAEALSEPDKAIDAHPAAHEALLARRDLRQEQGNFADATCESFS